MNTIEAINILEEYGLREKAEAECKRKKLDKVPYDMMGHHKVYCQFLNDKCTEIKLRCDDMKKVRCLKWDEVIGKPDYEDCAYAFIDLKKRGVCSNCELGKEIEEKSKEMDRLNEAIETLRKVAIHDYDNR
ncbi:MAG: hypothetical protein LUH19_00660 [Lachnospiraceae bacterium]|nr:hypothetical protein [Lachnospiraceae bacterium]